MRFDRSFRPFLPGTLEPRVVPSGTSATISNVVVHEVALGLSLPPVTLTASQIAASNASAAQFPLSTAQLSARECRSRRC